MIWVGQDDLAEELARGRAQARGMLVRLLGAALLLGSAALAAQFGLAGLAAKWWLGDVRATGALRVSAKERIHRQHQLVQAHPLAAQGVGQPDAQPHASQPQHHVRAGKQRRVLKITLPHPAPPPASRALVMLLPTPPLPDTTPMTFLTLLCGLGASCWGAALREEHAAPQLEQSWVHSSLILFVAHGRGRTRAVRFLLAQNTGGGLRPA